MINFHPYCPANTRPDTCSAPRFPFLEPEDQQSISSAVLPPAEPNLLANSLGLLFLQQPQMWTSLVQNLTQQATQKLSQVWKNLFKPNPIAEKKQPVISTTLLEACDEQGMPSLHAHLVKDVFVDTLTQYQSQPATESTFVSVACLNNSLALIRIQDKADLDTLIDEKSSSSFKQASQAISRLLKTDSTNIINISTGMSRIPIYLATHRILEANPELASALGLKVQDMKTLVKLSNQGQTNEHLFHKVNNAIIRYVDQRIDAPKSAYSQSRKQYQQIIQQAGKQGIAIVIATGRRPQYATTFKPHGQGADTNFLIEADGVIRVGAYDDQGTPSSYDDTLSSLSPWGNGRYNPTLLAPGVNIKTRNGQQNGTSLAAPYVAAVIRAMREVNPDLSVEEESEILQSTATKIRGHKTISHGAGVINPKLALQEAERRNKWFSFW